VLIRDFWIFVSDASEQPAWMLHRSRTACLKTKQNKTKRKKTLVKTVPSSGANTTIFEFTATTPAL
jgi:hypothetical protein